MNILIPVLSFSSAGGMRVLSKLANQFVAEGHVVEFLVPRHVNDPYYPTVASIIKFNNPLNNIPVLSGLYNLILMLVFIIINRKKYDIFLANYNLTSFPVVLGSIGTKKGFYYIQAYEPEFYSKKTVVGLLSFYIAKMSYHLPLCRVVNSPIYKHYKNLKSSYVVEPGIDRELFFRNSNGQQNKTDIDRPEINIGCIGRNIPWKGTKEIVQAVQIARSRTGANLVLNIAFQIPDSVDVTRYQFIRHTTPHGDLNLSLFYKKMDLFIATGLMQDGAFHYPCMEALASGCIVISNYAPASYSNAIFLTKVNVDKLVDNIVVFLGMKNASLKKISDQADKDMDSYTWSNIAQKMLDVFKING
ncbi:glycosyltransferase [Pseudomonas sp. EL_65y_Pfl2_R95]|uniref:glycosyltransferase n=1 Tax=Pseudomonas sp. EL_65y_Pfl2_R95 TaxID=3088698 RepID=UPI0030DD6CC8